MRRSAAGMAHEATSARSLAGGSDPHRGAGRAGRLASESLRVALRAFALEPARDPGRGGVRRAQRGVRWRLERRERAALRRPRADQPLGGLGDVRPLARSRAGTPSGTSGSPTRATTAAGSPRTAFFPLYPLLTRGRRRARRRRRRRPADRRLPRCRWPRCSGRWCCCTGSPRWSWAAAPPAPRSLLLCVFPASLFLGAPYSESLFLLVLGRAPSTPRAPATGPGPAPRRRRRRPPAARACSLLLPLVLIYLYGPALGPPGDGGPLPAAAGWRRCGPVHAVRARRRLARARAAGPGGLRGLAGVRARRPARLLSAPRTSGAASSRARSWACGTGSAAAVDGARQLLSGSTRDRLLRAGRRRPVARRGAST